VANLSVAALSRVGSVVGNPHSAIERAPVKNTVLASASQATWLPKSQIKNQKSKIPPPGHKHRTLSAVVGDDLSPFETALERFGVTFLDAANRDKAQCLRTFRRLDSPNRK